ncbi:MAG: signal peptidase II [Acidobacteria bacterium]|nr:MAG: signal peptidase II [Acidobacteriota bacterium]
MTRVARLLLLVVVTASCVGCDQVTKSIARAQLAGRPTISLLGDSVRLLYAENPGGFMSLGADLPEPVRSLVFGPVVAATLTFLVWIALRNRALGPVQVAAVALVIAGGAGNLIDRALFGTVRDFMNLGIGTLRTGIFNVADFAVLAGVSVMLVTSHREELQRPGRDDGPGE